MLKKSVLSIFFLALVSLVNAINLDSLKEEINASNPAKRLDILETLGAHYSEYNQDSVAWIVSKMKEIDLPDAALRATLVEATALYRMNQFDSALAVSSKGRLEADKLGYPELTIDFNHTRAVCYYGQGLYANTRAIAERNVHVSDSIDYLEGQADAQTLLANVYVQEGELDKAMNAAKDAFQLYQLQKDESGLTTAHQLLGNIYLYKGDYPPALENYLKAQEKALQLKDSTRVASILNNIGIVNASMGNTEQAESYYLQSKRIRTKRNDLKGVGTNLISLGNLWVETRPLRARPYYEEALQLFRSSGSLRELGQALNNIGNTYYYSGEYESSISLTKEALQIQKEIGNKQEESLLLMNLGYSYMQLNKKQEANDYFAKSLALARKIQNKERIAEGLIGVGDYHEHFKNFEEATLYRNKYILFKDSILSTETAEKVAELQLKFETELKEQQIETLTRESELAELRLKQQNTTIAKQRSQLVFFVSFFFLFLLMIYGSYKRLKLRKQQELNQAIIQEQQMGLAAVVKATEDERRRIAKDLHDGIAQTISGVKLALDQLFGELNFESDMQEKRFQQTINYLDEAGVEVRTISHEMMPAVLQKLGLVKAISDFLDRTLKHTKFKYSFEYYGMSESDRLDDNIEINIFRVCQELIQNVIKHSGAKNISVQLLQDKNELVFNVTDDGLGFTNVHDGKGLGLENVTGRVTSLGGKITFEKAENSGLNVVVRVPLKN